MNRSPLPVWATEIAKSSEVDSTTAALLTDKLLAMHQMYQGQPAKSQKQLSEIRKQTNIKIEAIIKQTSIIGELLNQLRQDGENAIYFGHMALGHSLSIDSDEWFIQQLRKNLKVLHDAASKAIDQRQWPAHRPQDFVTRFWIDRIIDVFYQSAPSVEISNKSRSLFFRTTQLYLSTLNLGDSDMRNTVKQRIERHPYLSP